MVGTVEEVDGDQLRDVILQKGAPGLRRRLAAAHHVFADAGLADIDAELEQLTVNAGCTPTEILAAHPADQVSDLAGNDRSSRLAAYLPGPKQAKAGTMPGHDCFWFDDGQRQSASRARYGTERPTTGGPLGSASGVFSRSAQGCRFGGAEPGAPAAEQRANKRSMTE
jgi:hypothetical protein